MNRREFKRQAEESRKASQRKVQKVDWKTKLKIVRAFFKKCGEDAWWRYKKLPRGIRHAMLVGVIGTVAVPIAVKTVSKISNNVEKNKGIAVQAKPLTKEQKVQMHNDNIRNSLEQKYKISDRASFDKLYEDALPLIQLSMFPTECLSLDPYSDNGKVINTIGLGSFYYPENGDPKSSKWIRASEYFRKHGQHQIRAELALDMVDGWFRYKNDGNALNTIYEKLRGAELNVHEFAAVATVFYNSITKGTEVCSFVQKNYDNPLQCAQKIANLSFNGKFPGLEKRHLHEAFLYLNTNDYVQLIYEFPAQKQKGKRLYAASAMNLKKGDLRAGQNALRSGDEELIASAQEKMAGPRKINVAQKTTGEPQQFMSADEAVRLINEEMARLAEGVNVEGAESTVMNGATVARKNQKTIRDVIFDEVLNEEYANNLLRYVYKDVDTLQWEDAVEMAKAEVVEESQEKENSEQTDVKTEKESKKEIKRQQQEQNMQAYINVRYALARKNYDGGLKLEKQGERKKANKEFKKALKGFEELIKKGGDEASLRNDMAISYFHLGKFDKCIDECNKVLEISAEDKTHSKACYNKALAYTRLGDSANAIESYRDAMEKGANKEYCEAAIQKLENSGLLSYLDRDGR